MARLNVHLVVIDPQVDFMDLPGSALPVPGANEDMKRLARMIDRIGAKLDDIHVTLDSHRILDIAHPAMWQNGNGDQPAPFTIISADDIESGIWRPRNAQAKLSVLGGRSIGQYALDYARQLEADGSYQLMVWPPHCLIGTPGHNVHEGLMASLIKWESGNFASVDYVIKGDTAWVEHYGGLQAEVPMANVPSTSLNTALLEVLAEADIVALAGEALSHCVKATVSQIADNIGEEHIRKFHVLTNCSSPVPPVTGPNGEVLVDFPAIANNWLQEMKGRGMTLTTAEEFLA